MSSTNLITTMLQARVRRRLLRHPEISIHPSARVDCRKIRYISGFALAIGEGSIVEGSLTAEREGASISIGRHTFVGSSTLSCAVSIAIGDDVLISWGCSIVDHNSHAIGWSGRRSDVRDWYEGKKDWTCVRMSPVTIGSKSWLGMNTIVLKGVCIGEGAVVAAGSVVVRDVPSWTIVAGNPAKVIREIPGDER